MPDEPISPADQIIRDYPTFAYLLNDPEIGPLLLEAVDPSKGFDAATFQAKVMQTDWWKTTSESQRQWETLSATDPATAQAQRDQWKDSLNAEAAKLGVQLAPADLDWWVDNYLPKGISAADASIGRELARVYQQRPDLRIGQPGVETGDIPAVQTQLRQIGASYFRDLTQQDLDWWSAQIASGQQSIQSFQSVIVNEAKQQFPSFQAQIDAGVPLDQLFSGTKAIVANELELDPTQMDLMHDPRWSQLLGVPDEKGTTRLLTRSEALQFARSQDEWRNTASAKQGGADLTMELLKTFGAVA